MHNVQAIILILMKTLVQQADTLVQRVLLVLVVGRELEMNNALQDFQPIIKAQLIVEMVVLEPTVGTSHQMVNPAEKFAVNVQLKAVQQTVQQAKHVKPEPTQAAQLLPAQIMPVTNSAIHANINVTTLKDIPAKTSAKQEDTSVQRLKKTA